MLFCISTSLIWAPRFWKTLDTPLTMHAKTSIKYTMLLSLLLLQFQLILFMTILFTFNFTNCTKLLSGIGPDTITKKQCTQNLHKHTFLKHKFSIYQTLYILVSLHAWLRNHYSHRVTRKRRKKDESDMVKLPQRSPPPQNVSITSRYKVFGGYIFASLFCMSEKEHLWNKNVFYFTSKALFVREVIKVWLFRYPNIMTSSNAQSWNMKHM